MMKNTPGIMKTEAEVRHELKELKTYYDFLRQKLRDGKLNREEDAAIMNQMFGLANAIGALEWVLGLK